MLVDVHGGFLAVEVTLYVAFAAGVVFLILTRRAANRGRTVPQWLYRLLLIPLIGGMTVFGGIAMGWVQFATLFGIGMILPAIGEILALKFGYVGRYTYDRTLGPRIIGGLPIVVMVMWGVLTVLTYWAGLTAMVIISMNDVIAYVDYATRNPELASPMDMRLLLAFVVGVLGFLLDLVMDPVMTDGGFWQWDRRGHARLGRWYGIPWANYIGWFVALFVVVAIYSYFFDPYAPLLFPQFNPPLHLLLALLFPMMTLDFALTARERRQTPLYAIGMIIAVGSAAWIIRGWYGLYFGM